VLTLLRDEGERYQTFFQARVSELYLSQLPSHPSLSRFAPRLLRMYPGDRKLMGALGQHYGEREGVRTVTT